MTGCWRILWARRLPAVTALVLLIGTITWATAVAADQLKITVDCPLLLREPEVVAAFEARTRLELSLSGTRGHMELTCPGELRLRYFEVDAAPREKVIHWEPANDRVDRLIEGARSLTTPPPALITEVPTATRPSRNHPASVRARRTWGGLAGLTLLASSPGGSAAVGGTVMLVAQHERWQGGLGLGTLHAVETIQGFSVKSYDLRALGEARLLSGAILFDAGVSTSFRLVVAQAPSDYSPSSQNGFALTVTPRLRGGYASRNFRLGVGPDFHFNLVQSRILIGGREIWKMPPFSPGASFEALIWF